MCATMTKKNKMPEVSPAGWGPELERLYVIRSKALVFDFLYEHPVLVDLLKEAHPWIQKHFPRNGSPACLELGSGPPGTGDEGLVVVVATNLDPIEAFKRRQQFDTDWWRASMGRAEGKLRIRMEFPEAKGAPAWLRPTTGALDSLLGLPTNWDSYGARPVSHDCATYSLEVLYSIMRDDTPPPQVVPTSGGGVQLEWHMRGIDLEIEFRTPDRGHVVYENLKTGSEWEGEIPADLTQAMQYIGDLSR